jgi:hypothetical protein
MNRKPQSLPAIRRHLREIATDLYAQSARARNKERSRKLGRAADIATESTPATYGNRCCGASRRAPAENK